MATTTTHVSAAHVVGYPRQLDISTWGVVSWFMVPRWAARAIVRPASVEVWAGSSFRGVCIPFLSLRIVSASTAVIVFALGIVAAFMPVALPFAVEGSGSFEPVFTLTGGRTARVVVV